MRTTTRTRRAAEAAARRRRQRMTAFGAVGLVVVVVAVLVIVKLAQGSSHPRARAGAASTASVAVPAPLYARYTSVTTPALASAAAGYPTGYLYPKVTDDAPISAGGKPEVLYLGAEYCPYCATERWALVLALSRFGAFHGLTEIHSSADDGSGIESVPTWSFYHATYTSPCLRFVAVEQENVAGQPLQQATPAEAALAERYGGGSIPFVDMDGKAIISGAEYDPHLLLGRSFAADAASIAGGTSKLAASVYANAGTIVSDLCRMTGGQPAAVCHLFPHPITH